MSQPQEDDVELIRSWTRKLRAKRREGAPGRFGVRLSVTLGFFLLAFLASSGGAQPKPTLGLALFAMLFLFELPAAALDRIGGAAVHVWLESTGSRTETRGRALPGLARLGHALAGSGLSVALGFTFSQLASLLHSPRLAEFGQLQLFWGATQLLPLTPFKLGSLLKEHLGIGLASSMPWLRSAWR